MSKPYIDSIIVVEGKTDKQFLVSFLDAIILETNGSAISEDFLIELEQLSKNKRILVMTDPDSPGEKIRNTIIQRIPNSDHVYLDKKQCIRDGRVGLAQSSKDYVLEQLNNKVSFARTQKNDKIQLNDLVDLNLIGSAGSQANRHQLCKHLNIAPCNGKQLLQKLNWMNIELELVRNIIKL